MVVAELHRLWLVQQDRPRRRVYWVRLRRGARHLIICLVVASRRAGRSCEVMERRPRVVRERSETRDERRVEYGNEGCGPRPVHGDDGDDGGGDDVDDARQIHRAARTDAPGPHREATDPDTMAYSWHADTLGALRSRATLIISQPHFP